jgi:Ser/Thr protein kinase RdoA (MazF antagonist)
VTLVDWESGGLGLAVVDLGNALLECHLDADLPDDQASGWLIAPSPVRIRAVASGYARIRALSGPELTLLPAAVKFTAAVVGSVHFEAALADGMTRPAIKARIARLENRLGVAEEVAAIAQACLTS